MTPTLALALSQIAPQYNAREHTRAAERMVQDMEKNTHTPGPWGQEEGPDGTTSIWADVSSWPNSPLGGTVVVASVPGWPCCRDEERANARLIASAPDLLAELGAMLRLVDGLPWHIRDAVYKAFNERTGGLPGSLPKPIAAARAAIAKAKGVGSET